MLFLLFRFSRPSCNYFTVEASKEEDCITRSKIPKDVISDTAGQFLNRGSPVSSSPTLFSNVSSSMPPLFPRPSTSNSLSKHDILAGCATTDSLMMPSFPPSLYSPSLPLFGHRYFSALNHAAAASLLPHQSNLNPFLRAGAGTLAQHLESNGSSSSSIQSETLGKVFLQSREECPSATSSMEGLPSQVLSQVGYTYLFIFTLHLKTL